MCPKTVVYREIIPMKLNFRRIVDLQALKMSMADIYSTKNEEAKGRLISLGSGLVAAFYNVFITGIFYTGFLSMYGISITGVGIVTFIPYIASCFSLFSSAILERIKKRKDIFLRNVHCSDDDNAEFRHRPGCAPCVVCGHIVPGIFSVCAVQSRIHHMVLPLLSSG